MQPYACDPAYQPVRYYRRKSPVQERVFSLFPPAADKIVILYCFEQFRYIIRVVLEIAVHCNDNIAPCKVKTSGKCGCLPEVSPQAEHKDIAAFFLYFLKEL